MMSFGNRFSVVAALSLGPAVSNSFARFAYALMLPAMRADLGLNYSQAGALNTANAIGTSSSTSRSDRSRIAATSGLSKAP